MSRKKQDAGPKTEPEVNEQETGAAGETGGMEAELPESITLKREEFIEVKARIDKLQRERDDTVGLAQRLQADFDNYRKRNAVVHFDSLEEGRRNLIKELLPVLDNFDRAMQNTDGVDKGFVDGMGLVQRQLMDVLKKNGMEEIPTDGKFNPELHEAVMQGEEDDAEPDTILEVFQKGYRVKDRIIRHSMVKVAR